MKNLILILVTSLFLIIALCSCHIKSKKPPILIEAIHMGAMQGDTEPSEFSVLINFVNHGTDIDKWKFGFYMSGAPLYTLINDSQKYNPKLIMQICNNSNYCVTLKYEKAEKVTDNDLSQGYTTILSPISSYPLIKERHYTIKILHINQWGGENVSYFPQNLFFILRDQGSQKDKVYSIDTNFSTYKIINYDQKHIDAEINNHNNDNWNKSIKCEIIPEPVSVVPNPVQIQMKNGRPYEIINNVVIYNQFNDNTKIIKLVIEALKSDLGIRATIDHKEGLQPGILIQKLEDSTLLKNNPEGYILTINDNNIVIKVLNEAGIYYAFQTLRQLWIQGEYKDGATKIPQLTIIDYPRFKYRGILLDTARHFFSVTEIKSLIDLIGSHKLNTLHLHLSDDEAFRVALPSYPSVQSIGNIRGLGLMIGPTMFPQASLYYYNDKPIRADNIYEGTYSAEDIVEIREYANLHQITVIPEIDLPAHSRALIKALPNVFVDPEDKSRYVSAQGYTDDVLPVCTYNTNVSIGPKFTKTINNIIHQVAELFSGQTTVYAIENEISVGGDEVSPNAWTESASCQGSWKNLNALQKSHKFFQEISKNNSTIILSGWQQFVQTDGIDIGLNIVPANKVGHVWVWSISDIGISQATNLANKKFPTVLAFADKTYFDIVYTPDIHEPGFAWATKYSDTHAALSSIEPATKVEIDINEKFRGNILGLEGGLWSEHITNYQQLIYMSIPKMAGLSEASWSPLSTTLQDKQLNWQSLAKRLGCGQKGFLSYLSRVYGVHYRGYPNGIKLEIPSKVCN